MAAGPVEDRGEIATCTGCGQEVRQKAMIPVLEADGSMGYRCIACARALLTTGA